MSELKELTVPVRYDCEFALLDEMLKRHRLNTGPYFGEIDFRNTVDDLFEDDERDNLSIVNPIDPKKAFQIQERICRIESERIGFVIKQLKLDYTNKTLHAVIHVLPTTDLYEMYEAGNVEFDLRYIVFESVYGIRQAHFITIDANSSLRVVNYRNG